MCVKSPRNLSLPLSLSLSLSPHTHTHTQTHTHTHTNVSIYLQRYRVNPQVGCPSETDDLPTLAFSHCRTPKRHRVHTPADRADGQIVALCGKTHKLARLPAVTASLHHASTARNATGDCPLGPSPIHNAMGDCTLGPSPIHNAMGDCPLGPSPIHNAMGDCPLGPSPIHLSLIHI